MYTSNSGAAKEVMHISRAASFGIAFVAEGKNFATHQGKGK
jgi:hypothetical protein